MANRYPRSETAALAKFDRDKRYTVEEAVVW